MTQPSLSTYGGRLHELGYAGGVVDENPMSWQTMVNDQALAIAFGAFVARSASDNTCKAPTADGDKVIGIAVRHAIRPAAYGTDVVSYAQYDAVPVLRDGFVYVLAAENVTRGDAVLSLTAGNGTVGGTTGGAAGAGRVAVPGHTWETTTPVGAIGILRVNF